MKGISQEEFFKQISVNSGLDLETARTAFYGMIRTITKELRAKKDIKLPDFGEFSLKVYKERKRVNVNTGEAMIIPPRPVLKFVPDYKLKRYFIELWEGEEDSTMIK